MKTKFRIIFATTAIGMALSAPLHTVATENQTPAAAESGAPLTSAAEGAIYYVTKPNTGGHPFPTAFPVALEGKTLNESRFDWDRYINEAVSLNDEMFRASLAFSNGFKAYDFGMLGTMNTVLDEETRKETAEKEVAKNCLLIESMYRERLKDNAEQTAVLESFIAHHRSAITASVALVGQGRDGAPAAKAAILDARLNASIVYRSALLDLRSSPEWHLEAVKKVEVLVN